VKGCAPRWQFCHVDDLVSALEFTVCGGITGDFAVGCDGWLEQDEVKRISGLKSIEMPAPAGPSAPRSGCTEWG